MVKDIVCDRELDEKDALKSTYGDRPFYFHNKTCQTAFINDPLKFVEKTGNIGSNAGADRITESGSKDHARS